MRPQQQNRRMRGRGGGGGGNNNNNNNRKGPNPLTRSYESNGPDVKIRGTAQQVADKYATLARDAQSSGDRVMAENYLQHAEHYNRIIAAAMAQQQQFQQQQRDNNQDDFDGDDEDRPERETRQPEQQPQYHVNGFGPQPVIDDQPSPNGVEEASGGDSEQPNGNGHQRGEADDGEGQQRRGRRQRRPMRARPQGEGGDDAAPEAEAPQTPEAAE